MGELKMAGIVLESHGGPEKLLFKKDVDVPKLKPDEVLVNVEYCGMNHLDIWLRKGGTGDKITLPRIPGSDVVGRVAETGSEVKYVQKGDYVVLYPGKGCGACPSCINGRETLCRQFQILGYNIDGGYAEYVVSEEKRAVKIPDQFTKQWAGVPVAYVTAWNALVTKGKLTANDTVVIWGASGGLGYAALSIAKGIGANAIGIVGDESKIKFLKKNGFDRFDFITRDGDVPRKVRELTGRAGADIVLDHVGRKTFSSSLQMLARGGRLAFCGVTTGPFTEVDLRLIFGKQITITGSWMGDLKDFLEVVTFLRKKHLFPHIDKEFSVADAKVAQGFMEQGQYIGKLVLENPFFEK